MADSSSSVTPPALRNMDLERKILAAAIRFRRARVKALRAIQAGDFFDPRHQLLFRALEVLENRYGEQDFDLMVVADHLSGGGEGRRIVESGYLAEVVLADMTGAVVEHHCGLVLEKAQKRRFIRRMRELISRAPECDLKEIRRQARECAEGLRPGLEPEDGPPLLRADGIEPQAISWLWPDRLARGKVTLLAGNPGVGKSFLTLDWAARVSTGSPWPDHSQGCRGHVILLSAEDHPGDTIVPRLIAAGADRTRIDILPFDALNNLDEQQGELGRCLEARPQCRLVVIDPISAYLGKLDDHRNSEVRRLLSNLGGLAQARDAAFLIVTHLNKSTPQTRRQTALHRITGSLAYGAAVRASFLVERDSGRPGDRLLVSLKNNVGDDQTGFRFRLAGEPGAIPRIEWDSDPVRMTAETILNQKPGGNSEAQEDVEWWLREILAEGPRPSAEVRELALAEGFAWKSIRRAQSQLGIKPFKKGYGGGWCWGLPGDDPQDDPEPLPAPVAEDAPLV